MIWKTRMKWKMSLALSTALVLAIGCTTTIDYPVSDFKTMGRTDTRVAVLDFKDLTGGEHALLLDDVGPWTYANLSSICADIVAARLRETGLFADVARIGTDRVTEEVRAKHDLVLLGEIKEFKAGYNHHPTVYINPASLLTFIGIPTAYGMNEGRSEIRLRIVDAASQRILTELPLVSSFGPEQYNVSWYSCWGDREKRGKRVLDAFSAELDKAIHDGGISEMVERRYRLSNEMAPAPTASMQQSDLASMKMSVTGTQEGAVKKWAVVVGLSKYAHAGQEGLTELRYARADAAAFRAALLQQGWSDDHIRFLVDKDATKNDIENWLRYGPDLDNSLLVLFWAGHGYPDPVDQRKLFLACYDTKLSNPGTGLRMSDVRQWLEERNARNVVVIADACHAGGLIAGRGVGESSARGLAVRMRQESVPPGWIYLLGARTDDEAFEHPSLQGGLFTTSLIEGMKGRADGYGLLGSNNGTVTMGELREYVRDKVKEQAFKLNLTGDFEIEDQTNTGDKDVWNLTLQAK